MQNEELYLSNLIGRKLRDAKDYEYYFKGAITSYAQAYGIINKSLTADSELAVLMDETYNAATSEFHLIPIPAMSEKMFINTGLLKLGTELSGACSVAHTLPTVLLNAGVANGELLLTGIALKQCNGVTVTFVAGVGANVDVSVSGTKTITVTLGTDADGILDVTKNTATLVAAAINATAFNENYATCVVATGGSAGGTGAGVIGAAAIAHGAYTLGDTVAVKDTITTPTMTGAVLYMVILTVANACKVTITQGTLVCPTNAALTDGLSAGTHQLLILKDADTEACTITLTSTVDTATIPVSGISDGDSGYPATNIAYRARVIPVDPFKAGDYGLIN